VTPPLPPLALYVHFPWCVRKCPYCDFNSHALRSELPETAYIEALLRDLAQEAPHAQGRELQSVFLGGGTPSLFSAGALARLLEGCARLVPLASGAEITLEANPGTVERGRFADYRAVGVNRVSLGAQSFADAQLRRLGRIHAAEDTRRAVAELSRAGLDNFNLDLMCGLPQQTLDAACADIQAALALEPAHVSLYQLTLEPGTLFAAQPPAGLPDADACADMQRACQERLAGAGFERYEVSAYARAGARCRHNLNYWQFGDYLGIGAGAHGKHSRVATPPSEVPGRQQPQPPQPPRARRATPRCLPRLLVTRTAKWREPRRYLAAAAADAEGAADTGAAAGVAAPAAPRPVSEQELPFEYLMNALRLTDGFEPRQFERRTGLYFGVLAGRLARLASRGLVEQHAGRWRASARGFDLLNDLLVEFLPASAAQPDAPRTFGRELSHRDVSAGPTD